jgi:hypothetical protein
MQYLRPTPEYSYYLAGMKKTRNPSYNKNAILHYKKTNAPLYTLNLLMFSLVQVGTSRTRQALNTTVTTSYNTLIFPLFKSIVTSRTTTID